MGRISYQPNSTLTFTSRARLDELTLDMRRLELETRANFDRWSVSLLYGNYDKQPDGLTRREGVLGARERSSSRKTGSCPAACATI